MRHAGTRPLVRRMQAIDQALRARKWPTDKTLARDLEVDPRTIRRDLEFMRDEHQFGQRVARTRVRLDEQAASRYLQADLRVRRQAGPVENGLKDGERYRSAHSA
jgi:DeoR/GlpR family transcriptional regulator of sugar metabolism